MVRRAWRWLGRTAAIVLLIAIGVPALLGVALSVPRVRREAGALALDLANQQLPAMRIEVDDVLRLDPWGVTVTGVRVYDAGGEAFARAEEVAVRIAPGALWRGVLHLRDVAVTGLRAEQPELGDPPQEPTPDASDEPGGLEVRVDRLALERAQATAQVDGRALRLEVPALVAAGRWGTKPRLAVRDGRIVLFVDEQQVLRLAVEEGRYAAEAGGRVTLEGALLGAPVSVQARFPALDAASPYPVLHASLRLSGLRPDVLQEIGLQEDLLPASPISLVMSLDTVDGELQLSGRLSNRAGTVRFDLRSEGSRYRADVKVSPVNLKQWSGGLPDLLVGAALSATIDTESQPSRLLLRWRDLRIDGEPVASGHARLAISSSRVVLRELRLAGMEDAVQVSGRYHLERGDAAVWVRLRGFDLAEIPGAALQGEARGSVELRTRGERLSGGVDLQLDDLAGGRLVAGRASVTAELGGTLEVPSVALDVQVQEVRRADDWTLDDLTLSGRLSQRAFAGVLVANADGARMTLDVRGTRDEEGDIHLRLQGDRSLPGTGLRLERLNATYESGGRLTLALLVRSDQQGSARVRGALSARGDLAFSVLVTRLSLQPWLGALGVSEVSGLLSARARVVGSVERPRVRATVRTRPLRLSGSRAGSAFATLDADLKTGKIAAEVAMEIDPDAVSLEGSFHADLPSGRQLQRRLMNARYALDLNAEADLQALARSFRDAPAPLGGRVVLALNATGSLTSPRVTLRADGELNRPGDPAETQVALALDIRDQSQTELLLTIRDQAGRLLKAAATARLPDGGLTAVADDPRALARMPLQVTVDLARRDLSALRGGLGYLVGAYNLNLPATAAAHLEATSDRGEVALQLSGGIDVNAAALDPTCSRQQRAQIVLDATLRKDKLRANVVARTRGRARLRASLISEMGVGALLRGDEPSWGPATLEAEAKGVPMAAVPGLCGSPQGKVDMKLRAENLFAGPIRAQLDLTLARLSARREELLPEEELGERASRAPELTLVLHAESGASAVTARAELLTGGQKRGHARARLPLSYRERLPHVPEDAPLSMEVRLSETPVGPVLSLIPALGQGAGTLEAELLAHGTLRDPELTGHVEFRDVGFSVAALAQPLHHLNGRIALTKRRLKIARLRAEDRGGSIEIAGQYLLKEGLSGEGEVSVETNDFPLRQQGSIIGELTMRAKLEAVLSRAGELALGLMLQDGRLWLSGTGGKGVQSLEPHPDVRFAGESPAVVEEAADEDAAVTLQSFQIENEQPFWLMHKDFSVQVGVDLKIERNERTRMSGEISLRRGSVNLLGKTFRIAEGSIVFTGDVPPDPELNLRAVFEPPTGGDLTVSITGRASAPDLSFSGAATTAGEAAMVLTGLNTPGADQRAQSDAAALAAGITAGLLSVTARRELGDWIPMITVQSDRGGVTGATAGFDATGLVPEFMEGFARGVYIEGMAGRRGDARAQDIGIGVQVEVALPMDFITSLSYGPGTSWSTDLYWSR